MLAYAYGVAEFTEARTASVRNRLLRPRVPLESKIILDLQVNQHGNNVTFGLCSLQVGWHTMPGIKLNAAYDHRIA